MIKTFTKGSSLAVLFVFLVGHRLPMPTAAEDIPPDNAVAVVNTVTIAGPPLVVFDFITTARFWPQWHPASLAVGGVTERPYRFGDSVHEWGRIGAQDFHIIWKVVEYQRPSRVVLQSETPPVQILYTFEPRDGKTVFTRTLRYSRENPSAEGPPPEEMEKLLQVQSQQALEQLKALVEKMMYWEAKGLP